MGSATATTPELLRDGGLLDSMRVNAPTTAAKAGNANRRDRLIVRHYSPPLRPVTQAPAGIVRQKPPRR